ncbi:MAG: hypothetical protein E7252_02955 [Lachnospira sp.]|nr:hypothetical protein [Lachnospira sp.]
MKSNTIAYIAMAIIVIAIGVVMYGHFTKKDDKKPAYDPKYSGILDEDLDDDNVQSATEASGENMTQGSQEQPTSGTSQEQPTSSSTVAPTQPSTVAPTQPPTDAPTQAPTEAPTQAPTEAPTQAPTEAPTQAPTEAPGQQIVVGDYVLLTLGNGKAAIDKYCGTAENVVIPSSIGGYTITTVKYRAFDGTVNTYGTVTIPKTVTNIEPGAFMVIGKFVVESGNPAYKVGQSDFLYTIDEKTLVAGINYARNSMSSKVETIGAYAFYGCRELTYMDFPESLKTIGNYAFTDCYQIRKLTYPVNLTSIGKGAFQRCGALIELGFLNKDTAIGTFAFNNCNNINKIYGYSGSTAQALATEKGCTFKLWP